MKNITKKCRVVMLPTEKATQLNLFKNSISETPIIISNKFGETVVSKKQHLYILSDEKIEVGDWCYDTYNKVIFQSNSKGTPGASKKVIATTDTSLREHDDTVPYPKTKPALPQPSQGFIQEFIKAYNSGSPIEEVMVDYEEIIVHDMIVEGADKFVEVLRVSPKDNTISISKVKDRWSREEVHNLMMQSWINGEANVGKHYSVREKWIEENL